MIAYDARARPDVLLSRVLLLLLLSGELFYTSEKRNTRHG